MRNLRKYESYRVLTRVGVHVTCEEGPVHSRSEKGVQILQRFGASQTESHEMQMPAIYDMFHDIIVYDRLVTYALRGKRTSWNHQDGSGNMTYHIRTALDVSSRKVS
jgi:hypothetical protein